MNNFNNFDANPQHMIISSTLQRIFFSALSLLILNVSCNTSRRSLAIEEGWDLLGEKKVDFVRSTDIIEIHSSYKFTALRFKVEKHEVRLSDLKIHFQNGDRLEPALDEVLPADQYSREVELAPDGKFIYKIEFKYRTTGNIFHGRANMLIFGKRYTGH
jgi:hypothetical protein